MVDRFEDYREVFAEIDESAKIDLDIYVIGGAVMLYRDLKPATKDIDIVLTSKKEYDELVGLLKDIGFKSVMKGKGYENLNLGNILKRGDMHIDLFFNEVCSKFAFSKNMTGRAEKIISLNSVNIYLSSNEDIFAFKTMTDREGDLDDCIALARASLNWDIILDEIKSQVSSSGKDVWITWINERLEILEERGAVIPIIEKTRELTLSYYDYLEKRHHL
jgi:hypothetical protein